MNAEEDDDSYDPNAAAELFFAQQKARDEARSKLPTEEWIQAISRIMEDDNDNGPPILSSSASFAPPELQLSRLVTTMPPPPLNDSDGMIDLNTADTFISSADTEEKHMLNADEKAARRRIIEYLVQQLEEEMLPVTTSEEEMNVDEVDQSRGYILHSHASD